MSVTQVDDDASAYYRQIPGWFDWHGTYEQWARDIPANGTIVEVGCFMGRSTAFLAVELGRVGRHDVTFCAVDTWEGSPELMKFQEVRDGSFYERFQDYMRGLPRGAVAPAVLRTPSVVAAGAFVDGAVDRVWLDGDHSVEGLTADLEAWWPKLTPGGIIGGHDFDGFPGVRQALEGFVQRRGLVMDLVPPDPRGDGSSHTRSWVIRKAAPLTSWAVPEDQRKLLISVVTNHPFVPRQTVESLGALMLHAREHGAQAGFPQVDWHQESSAFTLDTLRDRALYTALCEGFSHILFLDADNVWPHDLLTRLLPSHELGIVGGLYHLKKPPHEPVALRKAPDDDNPNMYEKLPHIHEEDGPVEVDALGMGCTLVPVALATQIERPWFRFQRDDHGWMKVTEDLWFCQRAKAAGCRLWVDPRIHVGHVAHSVIGVKTYEPFVPVVEKAYRAKYRRLARQAAEAGAALRQEAS